MPVFEFGGKKPRIHPSAWISERATLSGDVEVGELSSVFEYAVIRGDFSPIKIGSHTNIQDNAVIHAGWTPCIIGNYVTIGHGAVIHGAKIGNNVIIGFNSSVLDGAEVKDRCIIGAGSVILEGTVIEEGKLVAGNPAKVIKGLSERQLSLIHASWSSYESLAQKYKKWKI
jgi:carbonic anhydrase/acetyltransferase-like protein (isoleucine patch superfamily)